MSHTYCPIAGRPTDLPCFDFLPNSEIVLHVYRFKVVELKVFKIRSVRCCFVFVLSFMLGVVSHFIIVNSQEGAFHKPLLSVGDAIEP